MWKEIESEHQPKNKMYAYHGQQLKCKLLQPVDEQTPSTNSIDKPQPTSTNSIEKLTSAPSEDNVKEIKKECSSDPKAEHQMLVNEIEYRELISEKEKYKKVLEEVSLLATNSQQLSNEIQLWKDRFFQEQSKREAYELEIQELKNQAKAINEKSPLESPVLTNNNNDPNPISKNGLSHRSNAESSEKLKNNTDTKSSVNSGNETRTLKPGVNIRSNRGWNQARAAYNSSPLLIKGWFQIIIFALVFFILGRLFVHK